MNHEFDEFDAVPRRVGLYNVKYRYNNEEHVTEVLLKIGKQQKSNKENNNEISEYSI